MNANALVPECQYRRLHGTRSARWEDVGDNSYSLPPKNTRAVRAQLRDLRWLTDGTAAADD
jgi:hypothetical protein